MNEVTITGKLSRDPIVREGQYGQFAYVSVKVDDMDKIKGPYVFVEVSSRGVPAIQGLKEGAHVLVKGYLKSKQNKKTGTWETLVKSQMISPVQGMATLVYPQQPVAQAPVAQPQPMTQEQQMEQDISDIFG